VKDRVTEHLVLMNACTITRWPFSGDIVVIGVVSCCNLYFFKLTSTLIIHNAVHFVWIGPNLTDDIPQWVMCINSHWSFATFSDMLMFSVQNFVNFGPQTAYNRTGVNRLPTLCKFCILYRCQASHTEVRKQNSSTRCQTVESKSR